MTKRVLIPGTESAYRFSTPVSLSLSAAIGIVMGVWGALTLFAVSSEIVMSPGYGRMLVLFVAFTSAVVWVSAAVWFRESRVGVVGAALFGAVSPILGVLPFSPFGFLSIAQHPLVMEGFGVATGIVVQVVVCSAVRKVVTGGA